MSVNRGLKPVIRDSDPVILKSSNLKSYTFSDLSIATREFNRDAKLWGGDYYTFYKGYVNENTLAVAKWGTGLVTTIKRLKDNPDFYEAWLVSLIFQLLPAVLFPVPF